MIKNIVFDMGRVLIRFDPEYFLTREGVHDPEDRAVILKELFHSVEWAMMDRGDLSEDTAEPLVLKRIPERLHSKTSYLLHHWAQRKDTIPGMYELVKDLKDSGYGIYLLSNASTAQPEYWKQYPVSSFFDGTMISAVERCIKPSDEIYRRFIERFCLKPDECIFIDDTPSNVAAAIANGWDGIVFFGDAGECRGLLEMKGVKTKRPEA